MLVNTGYRNLRKYQKLPLLSLLIAYSAKIDGTYLNPSPQEITLNLGNLNIVMAKRSGWYIILTSQSTRLGMNTMMVSTKWVALVSIRNPLFFT